MRYIEGYEVQSHDMDAQNIARPSAVLRYMQETANHQLRDEGPSYVELFAAGKAFILSRIAIRFYRPLREYTRIQVATWACPAAGKGVIRPRCYEIRQGDALLAQASSVWALVDTRSHHIYRWDEHPQQYGEEAPLQDFSPRFRIPVGLELEEVGERTVAYADLDCNRHMNNTHYPDMLCNFVPGMEKRQLKELRLNFVSEAPLGERLRIFRSVEFPQAGGDSLCYFRSVRESGVNLEAEMRLYGEEKHG